MAKKTVKKTSKKAPKKAKKPIKVRVLTKILGQAPKEFSFLMADGKKLRSLFDLMDAFQDMSEDVFRHHVNDVRNDFSSWVHHVFQEPELASELKRINTKLETEIVLLRKLVKELQKK